MTVLPARSVDVGEAAWEDGVVLHDPVRSEIHVLNPTGAAVWRWCDGETSEEDLAAALSQASGVPADQVRIEVRRLVADLGERGLLGRTRPEAVEHRWRPDPPLAANRPGTQVVHLAALDGVVAVVVDGKRLAAEVRTGFASLVSDRPATCSVALEALPDGTTLVRGNGYERTFTDGIELFEGLASQLNRIAAASTGCLALHAGGVRTDEGRVVAVVGASGAGKSTLTAALVVEGSSYLTDEALGIRPGGLATVAYPKPLALDARSRGLLGLVVEPVGSVGEGTGAAGGVVAVEAVARRAGSGELLHAGRDGSPVSLLVLARFEPGHRGDPSIVPCEPADALAALAGSALNLAAAGPGGLEVLVELARSVPCVAMRHGDARRAASAVLDRVHRLEI